MSMSKALLGKCIDLFILLNELLRDTLHIYVPMAKKKWEKKEFVDVAFAVSEKEIEMKITASQNHNGYKYYVVSPPDKTIGCM